MEDGAAKDDLAAVFNALAKLPDKAVQEVIDKGRELLKTRGQERRREALQEIQRLAKEHGLKINAREPKRKPGRPPKSGKGEKGAS